MGVANAPCVPSLLILSTSLCFCYQTGLAITQIELEKIADSFDKDHSGMIDLSAIIRVLKGSTRRTRPHVQEALSDSEKIEHEVGVVTSVYCSTS